MILGKRATLGTAITWVFATILIFFIIAIFLLFVRLTVRAPEKPKVNFNVGGERLVVTETFLGFLDKVVEVEGETMFVKDLLVEEEDSEKVEKWKEVKENFLISELAPTLPDSVWNKERFLVLRVYEADEEISAWPASRKYRRYNGFTEGGSCDPSAEKSVVVVFYKGNLKTVLCVDYER